MAANRGKKAIIGGTVTGIFVFAVALISAGVLGGCATFSRNGGFGAVEQVARERLNKDVKWPRDDGERDSVRSAVKELLALPLSADNAVQVALLNNPGLQATYSELGIAEADLVQAGRMTNPHFAYLRTSAGGERKIEWALTFPIVDLLTMPLRTRIESNRFEQVKLAVAGKMLFVATGTRNSWIEAVAAEERVHYLEQVKLAAEASAELAIRMERAGNFNRLDRMREEVFHAETSARLARARQAAVIGRERLTRQMGLSGGDAPFRLPGRLPELPAGKPGFFKEIEARAMTERLDVRAAALETGSLAESLGLTRATRFINVLELGPAATKEDPEPWKRGFEVSLQLPIFDWGGARVAKAESIYMQALHRVAETAVNARSEVREAYSAHHAAYDTAKRYRDEIVPLRKKIAEENMLRYNGMLIGVFDLLADAREQVGAVIDYIETLRDFWLSESDLQAAFNGPSTGRRGAASMVSGGMAPNPAPAGH
jgi:outer membrane protein TolC